VGLAIDSRALATIYVLTSADGVYKSTDGGVSWREKNLGLPVVKTIKSGHLYANLLTMDPNNSNVLYIQVQGKIYKSTDGAELWVESSQGTSFPACGDNGDNIAGILVDPRNSDHLFAGTIASGCVGGLFESRNAGATWQQIAGSNIRGSGLDNDAWALAIDPTRPRRLYIGSIKQAFLFSHTGGQIWGSLRPTQAVDSSRAVAVDPASPNRVFLGNGNGLFIFNFNSSGILTRTTRLLPGEDIWNIQFAPSTPRIIYVTTGAGGLYKSTDGGQQWQPLGHTDKFPQSLAIHPLDPNIIYIGSAGVGVYQSVDGGQTFAARNSGLPFKLQVQTLVRHPQDNNIFYAGISANGLYKSLDRGQSWMKISSDANVADAFHLTINPANPDTLYSGNRAIKKSTDGGRTWTEILRPETAFFRCFALDPNHPDTLFTVNTLTATMYKSLDGGRTWSIKSSYAPRLAVAESIVVDPADSNRVYASSYDFFWKSTDGGETWRKVRTGLEATASANWIDAITIDPVMPNVLYIATRADRIFKSVDFGETWTDTGVVGPFPGKIIIDARDHNTLYVATLDSWFQSADGGQTWVERSAEGLPAGDFFQAKFAGLIQDAFDLGRFYIGTGLSGVLIFEDEG
jgi:photosystem II stability/assembly factor-like uncharacterized protein